MITNHDIDRLYVSDAMFHYFNIKINAQEDIVRIRIREFVKFILIVDICGHGPIPVSESIDEVWHYWILQTKQYNELISKTKNNRFIHHSSNDYESYFSPDSTNINASRELKILSTYAYNFGDFRNSTFEYWPTIEKIMSIKNMELSEVNQYLKGIVTKERENA